MTVGSNIRLSGLSQVLADIFSGEEEQGSFVQKVYGENEDQFVEAVNDKLQMGFLHKTRKSSKGEAKRRVVNTRKKAISRLDYPSRLSRQQQRIVDGRGRKRAASKQSINPYGDAFKEFQKFQVTLRNSSSIEKEIVLWGANQSISVSAPAPKDVEDQIIAQQLSLSAGKHPQGIVFNPVNNFVYVANQLSGSVSVFDEADNFVAEVQLKPTTTGTCSPVALSVNTNSRSTQYGFVYVACSVADEMAVIDLSLKLLKQIPTGGVRPLNVMYSPMTNTIYVANYSDGSITIFDGNTNNPDPHSPIHAGSNPLGLCQSPLNGEIYVSNVADNTVSVFDVRNSLIKTISGVGTAPALITYSPASNLMYVCCSTSNTICIINPATHNIVKSLPVGTDPYNCFYDPANQFIYVQNRASSTLSVIDSGNNIVATLNLGVQNSGGAYSSANGFIYVSDTINNKINVIGYKPVSSSISINPEYYEANRDFQSNPCQVMHVRFILSGSERISCFRHNRFQPTGSIKSRFISFEQFASPQHGLNVAEATALAGTLIDGKMNWRFKLPPLQTLTILIWFRQFLVEDLLAPNTKHNIL